jgi:hypothetical protein
MIEQQNNSGKSKKEINLNRYETDVAGVSMKTLETGLWWAKNRRGIKTALIIFLILVSVISWGYTIFNFSYYFLFGANADDQMLKQVIQVNTVDQNYLNQGLAKNLKLSPIGYLADNGKYDLYIQISNPNIRWWANFSYCFSRPDGEKACGNDFILPGEEKYLVSLAQSFDADPNDLNFTFASINWIKVNNHQISDWNSYQAEHLNLTFKNQSFVPAASNAVSEKVGLNTLNFNITDNGAFGYWELPLTIILTNGSRIVYIDRYTIDDLISYESRDIKITWPGSIGDVTGINLIPDLNILNQGVYEQPQ